LIKNCNVYIDFATYHEFISTIRELIMITFYRFKNCSTEFADWNVYKQTKKKVVTLGKLVWRDLTFNYVSYNAGGKVFLDCSGRRKTIKKKAATFQNWSILVGPPSPSALLSSVHIDQRNAAASCAVRHKQSSNLSSRLPK
jgi:hypothetical protein